MGEEGDSGETASSSGGPANARHFTARETRTFRDRVNGFALAGAAYSAALEDCFGAIGTEEFSCSAIPGGEALANATEDLRAFLVSTEARMDGGCPVISRATRAFLDGMVSPENPPSGDSPESAIAALQRSQALLGTSVEYASAAVNALKESCQPGRQPLSRSTAAREMDHLSAQFRRDRAFAEDRYRRQRTYLSGWDRCKAGDDADSVGGLICAAYETAADCAFHADQRADLQRCASTFEDDLAFARDL
jgi:hypothetical protein